MLADTGSVYVFNADGTEYEDADADPTTIDPYISVPGALWAGPPALGNLDDPQNVDDEIVAAAKDGRLFAWKGTGAEVADGDNNPLTDGVLFAGRPMTAPPLLVDFNVRRVRADGLPGVDAERALFNVNWPDELEVFRRESRSGHPGG